MPGVASRRQVRAIDERLGELHRQRTQCTDLIHRAMVKLAHIDTEADELLDARMVLLDDGR
jgi:hypothetical protein